MLTLVKNDNKVIYKTWYRLVIENSGNVSIYWNEINGGKFIDKVHDMSEAKAYIAKHMDNYATKEAKKKEKSMVSDKIAGFKFYSKLNLYKKSNCTFNPETLEAYSYGWWRFVEKIGRKIVFNDYNYSSSTIKHQYKTKSLLKRLGIKINMFIEAPSGLQNLDSSILYYENKIINLTNEMNKPKTHKRKNIERNELIKSYKAKIKKVKKLINQRYNFK